MSTGEQLARIAGRARRVQQWGRSSLRLGWSGVLALGVAVVTLAAAAVVFAAMLEDVLGHDGMALRDSGLDQAIADHRTPGLIEAAKVATNVGSIGLVTGLAIVAFVVFWFRGLKLAEAAAPLISLGVAAVGATALKGLVGRARPDVPIRLLQETEPSFPSGHATNSTALFVSLAIVAAVVVLRRPLARALVLTAGFGASVVIGLTRLELGVHWPSDVIAGWALGTMAAVAVTTALILLGRLAASAGPDQGRVGQRGLRLLGLRRCARSATSTSMQAVYS